MLERDEVLRAQGGDLDACSRLFERHWAAVRAWLRGYTRDRDRAEDLTQQTFLRAFTRLRQLRDPDRFLPWLRRVARTVALAGLRRRGGPEPGLEPTGESAAETAERRESARAVDGALDRIPREDRSLLALVYGEDLPVAEAARLTGLPPTTFRRRLAKALARFRRAYEREGGRHHGLPHRA
jgi:RNA polymerase sigma-70 factor (ECF subfamily)